MQHLEAAHGNDAATTITTRALLADSKGTGVHGRLHDGRGHLTGAHTLAAYVLRGESLLGSPSSDWMDTSTVRTLYAALHLSCVQGRREHSQLMVRPLHLAKTCLETAPKASSAATDAVSMYIARTEGTTCMQLESTITNRYQLPLSIINYTHASGGCPRGMCTDRPDQAHAGARALRMSRQMLPYWSTLGWKHAVSKRTVGALNG